MIYTKKEEIKWKSSKLRSFLFPSYLLIIDSKYDFTYQTGSIIEDPNINFQKFKNEMDIENFNDIQMKMLFNIFDVSYQTFILRDWKEFNSLLKKVFKNNFENLPEEISFLKDENYHDLLQEKIENLKKTYIENYKILKEIYLIPKENPKEENNTVTSTNPKLKTNLSVPELALLFKLLKDLKPDIFDVKSEAELHRFISTNFETKKTGDKDISTQKLRILFNQPDAKAAEFWEINLRLLQADVKKLK